MHVLLLQSAHALTWCRPLAQATGVHAHLPLPAGVQRLPLFRWLHLLLRGQVRHVPPDMHQVGEGLEGMSGCRAVSGSRSVHVVQSAPIPRPRCSCSASCKCYSSGGNCYPADQCMKNTYGKCVCKSSSTFP
jgi:hypothetical protein